MRPDVSELIGATCRILEDIVAPSLGEPYPQEVLQGVVGTLRALQQGWVRVLPFLHWDNTETAALLRRVAQQTPSSALATRIDALLSSPPPDPADANAAQACNQALRGLLAQVLADDTPPTRAALAPVFDDILGHLEERARRTPIRLVPEIPRSTPAPEA